MKKLPMISDTVFAFLSAWIVSACVFRYYLDSLPLCLFLSTVTAVAVAILSYLFLRARRERKFLAEKDETEKDKLMLHLTLDSAEHNRRLFCRLLRAEDTAAERKNGGLLVGERLIFLLFSMQPVSADEIAKLIKHAPDDKKTVYCNALSPEASALCTRFGLETVEGRELYLRLKEERLLPKTYLCGEQKKPTLSERFRMKLNKRLARPYFWTGTSIALLSFFTPYRIYYLVVGIALLCLALFVRLFGMAQT